MKTDKGIVRTYSALLALYPRRFRDEYGADMVELVREALLDEPTRRVGSRIFTDLAISLPTQHLEAHMQRPSTHLVPLIYTAIAGAGVLLALVGGTNITLLIAGVVVAATAGTAAVVAWRRAAPIGRSIQTVHWWKFVVAGPILIGGVIAAAEAGVDAWFVGMFAVFLGLILTGAGLLLGLVRLTTRRPPVLPT